MAMTITRKEGHQLYFYDPFTEPTTHDGWLSWLRRVAKPTIKPREESDFWHIAINAHDADGEKCGIWHNADLIIGEDAENQRKLVEISKRWHPFWAEMAKYDPKYSR